MTIPKFASVEEADAWFAAQERAKDHYRIADEIVGIAGPVWEADNGDKVLYSTVRTSTGKFAVAVFNPKLDDEDGPPAWGRPVYCREFARRKDAKARADAEWQKRRKGPRHTKAGNPL